eukprot:TRINITY_DN81518_c0_g1_i1.p1 TRINITY_DN81518_c0_g1~~TRINITY_DN81518_c0_g1_i1.p1  ORF type:complete len:299 (+),score=78.68 TRINITY_DN81518_c0_g1_i1:43-897(+)
MQKSWQEGGPPTKAGSGSKGIAAAAALVTTCLSAAAALQVLSTGLASNSGIGGVPSAAGPSASSAAVLLAVTAIAAAGTVKLSSSLNGTSETLAWLGLGALSKQRFREKAEPLLKDSRDGISEEAPESAMRRQEALERRPRPKKQAAPVSPDDFRYGLRQMRQARKNIASWAAVLALRGLKLEVNGQVLLVKLVEAGQLQVGEDVLELADIAVRLQGEVIWLMLAEAPSETGCRSFRLQMDDCDTAVELALTLKVLRAEADTGAGVGAFTDRPPDQVVPPPPAE